MSVISRLKGSRPSALGLRRAAAAPRKAGLLSRGYYNLISEIEGFFAVAFLIRVSLGMSVVGAVALLMTDQSMEILRVLAQDKKILILGLFAVSTLFLALMSWYWARVLLYVFEPYSFDETSIRGWAIRNLPRVCGIVPFLAVCAGFFRVVRPRPYLPETLDTQIFAGILVLAGVLAAIGLYLFFIGRRTVIRQTSVRNAPISQLKNADPLAISREQIRELSIASRVVLLGSIVLGAMLFLVFSTRIGQVYVSPLFGPASIMLLCFGTVIPAGSILVYFGKVARLPLLSLLVIAALLFSALDLNDNHEVRQAKAAKRSLPAIEPSFAEWLRNRADLVDYRDRKKPYPVFMVAAEGGGLRAAYFTALALAAIQDRVPVFSQHVFAISGVSGGSVGATVFAGLAAHYTRNQRTAASEQKPRLQEKADRILRRDFLSPVLAAGLFADSVQRFLPFPINRLDRARALERTLEHAWTAETAGPEFSRSFYDLWKDFPRESVPALFINTTRVETGERMIISNLSTRDDPNVTWVENLTDVDSTISVPLSTAACLSARFPFITPPGYLLRQGKDESPAKYRLVDGGYFENSGTATLIDVFNSVHSSRIGDQVPFRIILIRIGLAPSARTKYFQQGLSEVMSPFRTLLNTRGARGATSVRQMNAAVVPFRNSKRPADIIAFELREGQVPLPLGWLLSNKACVEITRQWDEMQGARQIADALD